MTRSGGAIARFLRDASGATALEFGLVLPVFAMLLVGIFSSSQLASTISSMNFAAQEAARCSAITKTVCSNSTTTATYASGRYAGPGAATPVFAYNTSGCGNTVTGTATYELTVGFYSWNIPISVAACYPASSAA